MIKLRKILLYNRLYYILFLLCLLLSLYFVFLKTEKSILKSDLKEVIVKAIEVKHKKIIAKAEEKILLLFNDKKTGEDILEQDTIKVSVEEIDFKEQSNFNLFSYKKYLYNKRIYRVYKVLDYKIVSKEKNIFYRIKNYLQKRISKTVNKEYLDTLLLGNNILDKDIKAQFQELGISHLFSISGMHVSLFSTFILYVLKKIKLEEDKAYFICSLFIIFYMFLANFIPSLLRSGLFFLFLSINKVCYFHIKTINVYIFTITTMLVINPYYIVDIGFLYSSIISLFLILLENKKETYWKGLIKTSVVAYLVSIPITIFINYEISLLSVLYNMFYVPFVSFLLFPLSFITLIFSFLNPLFSFFVNMLESITGFVSMTNLLIIFPKISIIFAFIYYCFLLLFFIFKDKKYLYLFFIILILHYFSSYIPRTYIMFIDVGQGDSILFYSNNKTLLLDTGGSYNNELYKYTHLPLLKSLGIKKIDYLVITHGDLDHGGEALNLINSFKVKQIFINGNKLNNLEKNLLYYAKQKNIFISVLKEKETINLNEFKFINLTKYNNKESENDNSIVLYSQVNNFKMLFMGDAGIKEEKIILKKYNISNLFLLKLGHHGSKTSSSEEFIKTINPKYSIISVSSNNRFNLPDKSVVDRIKHSKIYRTDKDGSVKIKLNDNGYNIKTCKS